jgi:hypothetical protein
MSNTPTPPPVAEPAVSRMIEVSRQDLETVCAAVLRSAEQWIDSDWRSGSECRHCSGFIPESKIHAVEMEHDIDCPALVARDIRPRATASANQSGGEVKS